MIRFADVKNIVITGTIIRYTAKPKGETGPPDSVEMQVDGYETDIMLLLSRLRWSWAGWALLKDIQRTDKTMLIIPWNELPYLDGRNWEGFNATSGSVYVPKIDDKPGPVNMDTVYSTKSGYNALVRFNPDMWNGASLGIRRFHCESGGFQASARRW